MIDKNNDFTPELLVPAGDMDCLIAGVQNGADAIYFGCDFFSARSSAKNFTVNDFQKAIEYCKIRNVKTHIAMNVLISNSEFKQAVNIAKKAYLAGVDAIIVQDLGFGKYLIDNFPNLEVHCSTQMSVHNLEGVLQLEKIGFKRVVLSRELSLNEIEYIRKNTNIDLEIFVHGALCISYSGQCLFSSLVGGRSGNRGKCAQPCRLSYDLIEKNPGNETHIIDKGYLLSSRDLCSLEYLPKLVESKINSFKIEGRMKTPEYVATVTRIYRKYLDMVLSGDNYAIDEKDEKDLLQVFNRGGFSSGHLALESNKNLIYQEKPNNIGLQLGNISNYNPNKGYITLKINEPLAIGDCISIDGETGKYTISELLIDNKNVKFADIDSVVKIGRMKGNLISGAVVYKMSSKHLSDTAKLTYSENSNLKRIPISCFVSIKRDLPICVNLSVIDKPPFYNSIDITYKSDVISNSSSESSLSEERIIEQFSKLGSTPYCLENIKIDLDENVNIPSISVLNKIRRTAINILSKKVISDFNLNRKINTNLLVKDLQDTGDFNTKTKKISLLLEYINPSLDYSKIIGIDNIYIPLKFLVNKNYTNILMDLSARFNMFVYMPTIIKSNYKNLLLNKLDEIVEAYNLKGFVISNIAGIIFLKKYIANFEKYSFVANFTMNAFNNYTIDELQKLGITILTPSIELDTKSLNVLITNSSLPIELIAYGKSILMNSSYCLLGKTNKCYPECKMKCSTDNSYYLKDRLGYRFRILPDNLQTVTAIYNSKITSIDTVNFDVSSLRINILDENIEDINNIIRTVKTGKKLEGDIYTNGNLNKSV